jgi:hypothetical protein
MSGYPSFPCRGADRRQKSAHQNRYGPSNTSTVDGTGESALHSSELWGSVGPQDPALLQGISNPHILIPGGGQNISDAHQAKPNASSAQGLATPVPIFPYEPMLPYRSLLTTGISCKSTAS